MKFTIEPSTIPMQGATAPKLTAGHPAVSFFFLEVSATSKPLSTGPPRPRTPAHFFYGKRNGKRKHTRSSPWTPYLFLPLNKRRQPVFVQHTIAIWPHATHGQMAILAVCCTAQRLVPQKERGTARLVASPALGITKFAGSNG